MLKVKKLYIYKSTKYTIYLLPLFLLKHRTITVIQTVAVSIVYIQSAVPCDKWVHFTTAWRVLRLRMEERLAIWRVATDILNEQSRTAEKGVVLQLAGSGELLTTLPR